MSASPPDRAAAPDGTRFAVVLMAAGHGTRMRSSKPKVLHEVAGRSMLDWAAGAALDAGADRVICVVREEHWEGVPQPAGVTFAYQREGEGTGAAVAAARDLLGDEDVVVVHSADQPLISAATISALVGEQVAQRAAAALLSSTAIDPAGYGRVVKGRDGSVDRIVETKHPECVAAEHLAIREVNLGTYAFDIAGLLDALGQLGATGGEQYLTDVFPLLAQSGRRTVAFEAADPREAMGANSRAQLMEVERLAQELIFERHALSGVTFLGAASTRVEAGVRIGGDSTIGPGVTLRGDTRIGSGCEIGPQTTITDSELGDGVTCLHSFLVGARVDAGASIGPFAYLRPGAHIGEGAKIGTFVEVKNSEIGAGAKVPHLSYLGDADVGDGSNVAAGNITANYDGFNKSRTTIGSGVRTGVNTSFIAPVTVGDGAYIGAGSVISEDVPPGALGISRPDQKNVDGYAERIEKERG